MARSGEALLPWRKAPRAPDSDVPCGGDTGKCPVLVTDKSSPKPLVERKFKNGDRVVKKKDPTATFIVGFAEWYQGGKEWVYYSGKVLPRERDAGTWGRRESALALPPKHPVGTWGGPEDSVFSQPTGSIEWNEGFSDWAYRDDRGDWLALQREFVVRPPDPSYRWPKVNGVQCGPLPGTRIHIVEHPATHEGHTFSERDSARLAAAQHGRILKAGQIRHDSQRGPMVAFSGMADYGQEIELFNCVPVETA